MGYSLDAIYKFCHNGFYLQILCEKVLIFCNKIYMNQKIKKQKIKNFGTFFTFMRYIISGKNPLLMISMMSRHLKSFFFVSKLYVEWPLNSNFP